MTAVHPSLGRPLRWVVVGAAPVGSESLALCAAPTLAEAGGDALVLDWMAASYLAPGVKPRTHAVVVRVRAERLAGRPPLVIVTATYPSDPAARPSGAEMVRTEGRLVGDAIVVARSAGLTVDTVVVESAVVDALARNEQVAPSEAWRAFIGAANEAVRPTTR